MQQGDSFKFLDAMSFTGKPPSESLGMTRVRMLDRQWNKVLPNGSYDMTTFDQKNAANEGRLTSQAQALCCIDIENGEGFGPDMQWRFDVRDGVDVRPWLEKVVQIIDGLHAGSPLCQIGWYGDAFADNYWTPVAGDAAKVRGWLAAHAFTRTYIGKHRLAWTAPSCYTFYDDRAGWQRHARKLIAEAKNWGVPCYPFIWMYYHNSSALKGLIPADYVKMQIETIQEAGAQGVVIWGGWQIKWNPQAEWLKVVMQAVGR